MVLTFLHLDWENPEIVVIEFKSKKHQVYSGQYSGDLKEFEIMQYTGLLDKNGKEIWEGDICRNGDYIPDAHTMDYRVEIVRWDKDNACWQGCNFNDDGMSCEVIGNVWENPELLKEGKKNEI